MLILDKIHNDTKRGDITDEQWAVIRDVDKVRSYLECCMISVQDVSHVYIWINCITRRTVKWTTDKTWANETMLSLEKADTAMDDHIIRFLKGKDTVEVMEQLGFR